jgi:osmotically-inducible protein OsmY
MKHALNVAAAFAAGAGAVYLLDKAFAPESGRWGRILPVQPEENDARLREAVRTHLDGLVSHPRAVEVEVSDGVVRVSGQVLAMELDGLLSQLVRIPGVHRVHNALATR